MKINDPIICRCEEITRSEVQAAIDAGCTSVAAVKKYTRAGMGACQGRTCGRLIMQMLMQSKVATQATIKPDTARFPSVACGMGALEGDE